MVDIDQCLVEALEPRIVWMMPKGYEVDAEILEIYAQHLLCKLIDASKERFGTSTEKDLQLHSQFNRSKIVWKGRK